jgi:hypothetical protein
MFNRGGVSAYGKGIASNLVTEEQRQRFNYGGRVGLLTGGNYGLQYGKIPPAAFEEMADVTEKIYTTPRTDDKWWNIYAGDDTYQYVVPKGSEDAGEIVTRSSVEDRPKLTDQQLLDKAIAKDIKNEPENQVVSRSRLNRLEKEMNAGVSDDRAAEVMTDSDWMDLLGPTEEQKKRTKGEAQLGLAAGALDVFSQPSIAKGMKAASPHLLNLGKTATADQKARDKAILQGKVLSKVYSDRAAAKGKADIATAEAKAGLLETGDTPRAHYHALKSKQGMKKAMGEALNYQIQVVKKDDDKNPIIPEGIEDGTVMWLEGEGFIIMQKGKPVFVKDVDLQIFGLEK